MTLLLDNSGSMRGRPITVAATADILARWALRREGRISASPPGKADSRAKPGLPPASAQSGRLNDLRHIIYKAADAPGGARGKISG